MFVADQQMIKSTNRMQTDFRAHIVVCCLSQKVVNELPNPAHTFASTTRHLVDGKCFIRLIWTPAASPITH
jgi:hypothetical protein